jgi:hypothetical protein
MAEIIRLGEEARTSRAAVFAKDSRKLNDSHFLYLSLPRKQRRSVQLFVAIKFESRWNLLEPESDRLQVLKKPGLSGKLKPKVRDIPARKKKAKTGNDVSCTTDHRLWSDVVKTTSKQHLEQDV